MPRYKVTFYLDYRVSAEDEDGGFNVAEKHLIEELSPLLGNVLFALREKFSYTIEDLSESKDVQTVEDVQTLDDLKTVKKILRKKRRRK